MNRIVWVDYGKAIAIYLVVLAHTALNKSAEDNPLAQKPNVATSTTLPKMLN